VTDPKITRSRIRRFSDGKRQFELYQGNYGNLRESYVIVREIGPRGALRRPFTPDYLELNGIDYEIAREQLIKRCILIIEGKRDIMGNEL
jgi:hypothetical protein